MEKDSMSGKKSPTRGTPPSTLNKKASASPNASRSSGGSRSAVESGSGKSVSANSDRGTSVGSSTKSVATHAAPASKIEAPAKEETRASAKVEAAASNKPEVKTPAQSPNLRTPSSSTSAKPAAERFKSGESTSSPISSEERSRLIAEAAYYIAEKRHFQGGDPAQDWIQAEKEVDSRLSGRR